MAGAESSDPHPRLQLGVEPEAAIALFEHLIDGSFHSLAALVAASGMSRRQVEILLHDLPAEQRTDSHGNFFRIKEPQLSSVVHALNDYRRDQRAISQGLNTSLTSDVHSWLNEIPVPKKSLDHVQATEETVLKRAEFLATRFDLRNRTVVFIGDHDLTSLALSRIAPWANIIVVDIDDDLLNYIAQKSRVGTSTALIQLYFADLRFGVPPSLHQKGDIIFSDPPYTPEGLQLFVRAGLTTLQRSANDCRIVLAYGHSRIRPDNAVAAQGTLAKQGIAVNAMIPGFNSYIGAEAIGSRADLYVCQPTTKALKGLDSKRDPSRSIYTHGANAIESKDSSVEHVDSVVESLVKKTGAPSDTLLVFEDGYGRAVEDTVRKMRIDTVIDRGISSSSSKNVILVARADHTHRRLLRLLLATGSCRFDSVNVVQHAPTKAEWSETQREDVSLDLDLAALALTGDNMQNSRNIRIMSFAAAHESQLWKFIASRPHGSLQNILREGLIRTSAAETPLTKRDASDIIDQSAIGSTFVVGQRLVDLPIANIRAMKGLVEQLQLIH